MTLERTTKADPLVKTWMSVHYSQPKGFVGRQLIYKVMFGGRCWGAISAGSATKHLPGREAFFGTLPPLNNLVNNTFFHIEKGEGYPCRNFAQLCVCVWRKRVLVDWPGTYGSPVSGFETLVELPRTGELYRRDGWSEVGLTKGFTCKRVGGESTDSWSGRRVWDLENLRPKRVFVRRAGDCPSVFDRLRMAA